MAEDRAEPNAEPSAEPSAEPRAVPKDRSGRPLLDADRLVFFTDAVVAIALTLLVLPLLEAVPERDSGTTISMWLGDHVNQLLALMVSFLVVASSWTFHHRIWSHVALVGGALVWLDVVWMGSIVFLQVPTALVYAIDRDRELVALYTGTILLGSLTLAATALVVAHRPAYQDPDAPPSPQTVPVTVATAVVYLVAFVVAVGADSYSGLGVLFLIGPARRLAARWSDRSSAAHAA